MTDDKEHQQLAEALKLAREATEAALAGDRPTAQSKLEQVEKILKENDQ